MTDPIEPFRAEFERFCKQYNFTGTPTEALHFISGYQTCLISLGRMHMVQSAFPEWIKAAKLLKIAEGYTNPKEGADAALLWKLAN